MPHQYGNLCAAWVVPQFVVVIKISHVFPLACLCCAEVVFHPSARPFVCTLTAPLPKAVTDSTMTPLAWLMCRVSGGYHVSRNTGRITCPCPGRAGWYVGMRHWLTANTSFLLSFLHSPLSFLRLISRCCVSKQSVAYTAMRYFLLLYSTTYREKKIMWVILCVLRPRVAPPAWC